MVWFNPKNCLGSGGGSRALLGWGRRGRRAGRTRDLAFPELLARCWGIADTSVLAGAAWVSWQRWLRKIREQPQEAEGDGWLGWPEPDGLLSPPRSLQRGFGKPTCCQISALIIFFQIKGIIFVLGTSTSALSLLPFSLSLSHTHTFLLPWGILAARGSEKQIPASFLREQGKGDARWMLDLRVKVPSIAERDQKTTIHPRVTKPKVGLRQFCLPG